MLKGSAWLKKFVVLVILAFSGADGIRSVRKNTGQNEIGRVIALPM
jgi:hypothetical protein